MILLNNLYQDPVGPLVQDLCIRTFFNYLCKICFRVSVYPSTYDGFLALAMQNEVHVRKRARTPGKTAPSKLRFLAANFVLYLFLILNFSLEIEIWVLFI